MAQASEKLSFATGVTTPLFRFHPAVVAEAAATLDRLSGGRFHLGVGTGENLNEGPLGYVVPKWEVMLPWRGLRAPGRLEAVDPAVLRERADELPREEVLGRYSMVTTPDEIVDTYAPLVTEVKADIVTIQIASLDQEATISMLGSEVLTRLRQLV